MRTALLHALAAVLASVASLRAAAVVDLAQGFAQPPDAAKPWAYWWWLDSNASKEGITRDLEEMKRQGIAGVLIFDAGIGGPLAPDGPVFMSNAWRELFRFAIAEANRLGLEASINLCSGWNAGGTWVKPEYAAQMLVWSQTQARGPGEVALTLPQPPIIGGYYRDVAVLAVKTTGEEGPTPKLAASSSYPNYPPALAADGDPKTRWISNGDRPGQGPKPDRPEFLSFEFAEPFPAASLYLVPYSDCGPRDCELQASSDGKSFKTVCRFVVEERQPKTVTFDEVSANAFRVVVTSSYPFQGKPDWNVQIAELALLKRGQKPGIPRVTCESRSVVDLTVKIDASGRLAWQAPAGYWTILRLGHTLVGAKTSCTSPGSQGYEIDPFSREAMDMHFAATAGKLVGDISPLVGKTLKYTHIDSWELHGDPNWSPDLRDEFKRRRGYDPLPFLPALAGKIVDSPEVTARFLWDFHKTLSDCIAANYYGRLRELSQQHGMGIHPESGGPCTPVKACIDALQILGISDIPMGEFWARQSEPAGPIAWADWTIKQAASAAHIYGKPLVQAEAFTTMGPNWEKDPFMLKDIGDHAFCCGVNRAMLCFYVHQPYLDRLPGHQWEAAGTHFDRNVTWWPLIHAWLLYLARCQFLLQQGLFVADACYFYGEDAPNFVSDRGRVSPPLPAGYDYDVCNAEVILTRMAVRDGRLVLPDGMSYRLLVLPEREDMSLAVMRKIAELVEAGATVVGPKPVRAPGLAEYPNCDEAVRGLADRLWGNCDGKTVKEHVFGKGRIICGKTLGDIFQACGALPDFKCKVAQQGARIDYIHRSVAGAEIYFVANLVSRAEQAECLFRVSGKQPEIWDAVTGERRDATDWRVEEGRTVVPLAFAPRQSWFVVFRRPATPPAQRTPNVPQLEAVHELTGPWRLKFDPKRGGPESVEFETLDDWSKRPEEGIRHYSGSAAYLKTFDLPEALRSAGTRLYLDLGKVQHLAAVRLNGKDLGVVWTAPWHVEITEATRPTGNALEIDVVNLWPNRLIGDAPLPPEKRLTTTNVQKFYKGKHPLLESGLFGPVRILRRKP